ncbi:Elongin-C [Porphyridium purpureum]|uniref:Elongin-C n=1 Tax=Porphyridium purpureum TaxID=35688 RepID=A0A5J4YGH8_PORPP|nr:Elongin-C [Porphyridium purpureum]KAA8490913.1 Elongin-C [Porphyridium purpureum]|eukprot:POR8052..scf289_17
MVVPSEFEEVPEGYLRLVSGDGFEFLLHAECAHASEFIRTLMDGGFAEAQSRTLRLPEIPARLLETVCQYFYFRNQYKDSDSPPPIFNIPRDAALELLMVANFLLT